MSKEWGEAYSDITTVMRNANKTDTEHLHNFGIGVLSDLLEIIEIPEDEVQYCLDVLAGIPHPHAILIDLNKRLLAELPPTKELETLKMAFAELESGYFLFKGKLYLAHQHRNWTVYFPVKNGVVSRQSDDTIIHPVDTIEVIPKENWPKFGIPPEGAKFEQA